MEELLQLGDCILVGRPLIDLKGSWCPPPGGGLLLMWGLGTRSINIHGGLLRNKSRV